MACDGSRAWGSPLEVCQKRRWGSGPTMPDSHEPEGAASRGQPPRLSKCELLGARPQNPGAAVDRRLAVTWKRAHSEGLALVTSPQTPVEIGRAHRRITHQDCAYTYIYIYIALSRDRRPSARREILGTSRSIMRATSSGTASGRLEARLWSASPGCCQVSSIPCERTYHMNFQPGSIPSEQ